MTDIDTRFLNKVVTQVQKDGTDQPRYKKWNYTTGFGVAQDAANNRLNFTIDTSAFNTINAFTSSVNNVTIFNTVNPSYAVQSFASSGSAVVLSCSLLADSYYTPKFIATLRDNVSQSIFYDVNEYLVTYVDGEDPVIDFVNNSGPTYNGSNGVLSASIDTTTNNIVFSFTSTTGSNYNCTLTAQGKTVSF